MSKVDLDAISDSLLAFCWQNLRPRERAKVLAKAPKTVWWFGAGASHHYAGNAHGVPLPLASNFFAAFNDLPTFHDFQAYVGPLIAYLGTYRGVAASEVPQWRENIEEFMTSVEAEIASLSEATALRKELNDDELLKGISLVSLFNSLGFILASVVNEAGNGPSDSLYRYLLEFCSPNDAFITFNWDTVLDRALVDSGGWSPNDGYGLTFSAALDGTWKPAVEGSPQFLTNWRLLKLHGSTNWLVPYMHVNPNTFEYQSIVPESDRVFLYWQSSMPYCTHRGRWRGGYVPTCYCYYPPNIPGSYFDNAEIGAKPGHVLVKVTTTLLSAFDEPEEPGIPASAALITPVRQKKYDTYRTTLNGLWAQSTDALTTTDRVVIIGYSFPSTDTRALELLGDALAGRPNQIDVTVVAPDARDIISRIGEARLKNARSITPHNVRFEEYLEILARRIPVLMKEAGAEFPEVRDWVARIFALNSMGSPVKENRGDLNESPSTLDSSESY